MPPKIQVGLSASESPSDDAREVPKRTQIRIPAPKKQAATSSPIDVSTEPEPILESSISENTILDEPSALVEVSTREDDVAPLQSDSLDWKGFDNVLLALQRAHDVEISKMADKITLLERRLADPWKLKAVRDAEFAAMRSEICVLRNENSELRKEFALEFGPRKDNEMYNDAHSAEVTERLTECAAQAAAAAEAAQNAATEAEQLRVLLEVVEKELEQLRDERNIKGHEPWNTNMEIEPLPEFSEESFFLDEASPQSHIDGNSYSFPEISYAKSASVPPVGHSLIEASPRRVHESVADALVQPVDGMISDGTEQSELQQDENSASVLVGSEDNACADSSMGPSNQQGYPIAGNHGNESVQLESNSEARDNDITSTLSETKPPESNQQNDVNGGVSHGSRDNACTEGLIDSTSHTVIGIVEASSKCKSIETESSSNEKSECHALLEGQQQDACSAVPSQQSNANICTDQVIDSAKQAEVITEIASKPLEAILKAEEVDGANNECSTQPVEVQSITDASSAMEDNACSSIHLCKSESGDVLSKELETPVDDKLPGETLAMSETVATSNDDCKQEKDNQEKHGGVMLASTTADEMEHVAVPKVEDSSEHVEVISCAQEVGESQDGLIRLSSDGEKTSYQNEKDPPSQNEGAEMTTAHNGLAKEDTDKPVALETGNTMLIEGENGITSQTGSETCATSSSFIVEKLKSCKQWLLGESANPDTSVSADQDKLADSPAQVPVAKVEDGLDVNSRPQADSEDGKPGDEQVSMQSNEDVEVAPVIESQNMGEQSEKQAIAEVVMVNGVTHSQGNATESDQDGITKDNEEPVENEASLEVAVVTESNEVMEKDEILITVLPGPLGLSHEDDVVSHVDEGSQANREGIDVGYRILAVDGERCPSFDDKIFLDASSGDKPYQITFSKPVIVRDGEDEFVPEAKRMPKRRRLDDERSDDSKENSNRPIGLMAKTAAPIPPLLSGAFAKSAAIPHAATSKSLPAPLSKSMGVASSKSLGTPMFKSMAISTSMSKSAGMAMPTSKSMGAPMSKSMAKPPVQLWSELSPAAVETYELEGELLDVESDFEEGDAVEPGFDELVLSLQQAHMTAVVSARYDSTLMLQDDEALNTKSSIDRRTKVMSITDHPNFWPPSPDFITTADSWNRFRDKERVEGEMRLREQGDALTCFADPKDPKTIVGKGYQRVLYGDHGPYIEFARDQVVWASFPRRKRKGPWSYYHEHYTATGFVKAYEQRKTVGDKPNPPPGRWTARNNRTRTGYADYQPGVVYIACDALTVVRSTTPCLEESGIDIDGLFTRSTSFGPLEDIPTTRRNAISQPLASKDVPIESPTIADGDVLDDLQPILEDPFPNSPLELESPIAGSSPPVEMEETLEDVERAMRDDVDNFFMGRGDTAKEENNAHDEAIAAVLQGFADGMPPDLQGQISWLQWPVRFAKSLGGSSYKAFVEKQSRLLLISCPKPHRFLVIPVPTAVPDIGKSFWSSYASWCHEECQDSLIEQDRLQFQQALETIRRKAEEAGHPLDDVDVEGVDVPIAEEATSNPTGNEENETAPTPNPPGEKVNVEEVDIASTTKAPDEQASAGEFRVEALQGKRKLDTVEAVDADPSPRKRAKEGPEGIDGENLASACPSQDAPTGSDERNSTPDCRVEDNDVKMSESTGIQNTEVSCKSDVADMELPESSGEVPVVSPDVGMQAQQQNLETSLDARCEVGVSESATVVDAPAVMEPLYDDTEKPCIDTMDAALQEVQLDSGGTEGAHAKEATLVVEPLCEDTETSESSREISRLFSALLSYKC